MGACSPKELTRILVGLIFSFVKPQVPEERSNFRINRVLHKHSNYVCRKVADVFPEADFDTSKIVQKIRPGDKVRFQGKVKETKSVAYSANFAVCIRFFSNDETDTIYWWQCGALS